MPQQTPRVDFSCLPCRDTACKSFSGGAMLKTPLCQQLGIEYPIFSVGMGGGMAGPELVAAVSNAGGCGVLGMGGLPAPYIRKQIQQLRTLTTKPFGVNIIL